MFNETQTNNMSEELIVASTRRLRMSDEGRLLEVNKKLLEALKWVTESYLTTLSGLPVRDADEAILCADLAIAEAEKISKT